MMGAMDARNMYSNLAVNKYLHTVASCWIRQPSVHLSSAVPGSQSGSQNKASDVTASLRDYCWFALLFRDPACECRSR